MNRSDFKKKEHGDFAMLLLEANNNSGSIQPRRIFEDFCFLASCAYRQATNRLLNQFDNALEQEYLRRVRQYPNSKKFAEALAVMTLAMDEEPHDFLGACYMGMESGNKNTGQFFTPQSRSDACALMMFDYTQESFNAKFDSDPKNLARRRCLISDPCIGAGSMIIAVYKIMKELDIHPRQWWVEAIDVDPICSMMCYIQFTMLGIPASVYTGNTLGRHAGKEHRPWITLIGAMFPLTEDQKNAAPVDPIVIKPASTFRIPLRRTPIVKSS